MIDRTVKTTIKYDDDFGTHSHTVHIAVENKSIWLLVNLIKILLRPISFVGYVGQKEMMWTNGILSLAVASIIVTLNLPHYLGGTIEDYSPLNFAESYYSLAAILFVWLMQLGKRLKDLGKSPWYTMLLTPVIILPLIIIHIGSDDIFFTFCGVAIMFLTCLGSAAYESENKNRYQKIKVW